MGCGTTHPKPTKNWHKVRILSDRLGWLVRVDEALGDIHVLVVKEALHLFAQVGACGGVAEIEELLIDQRCLMRNPRLPSALGNSVENFFTLGTGHGRSIEPFELASIFAALYGSGHLTGQQRQDLQV